MEIKKITQSPMEAAEEENLKATVEKQKKTIENQKVTLQYLAAMTDVFIPEEEGEDYVQNSVEDEGNV